MLNLSQRLILGCVLLVGLIAGLVVATHNALAAAGQSSLRICSWRPRRWSLW